MKIALILILLMATFENAFASNSYFSGRAGVMLAEAAGDLYSSTRTTYTGIEGDVNYGMSSKWGLKLGGSLSTGGEVLSLNVGATYHFVPIVWESMIYGDSATVSRYPLWIPYITGGLSLIRTQLPMVRKDGSQSDIVLAGLVGPSVGAGSLFTITQAIYLQVEGSLRHGFGSNLQAGVTTLSAGLTFVLP